MKPFFSPPKQRRNAPGRFRYFFVLSLFFVGFSVILLRTVYLQYCQKEWLQEKGDSRHVRTAAIPAHRAHITDRYGNPLAVSTPVYSVWLDPQSFNPAYADTVAAAVSVDADELRKRIQRAGHRQFLYVKRHLPPAEANALHVSGIPGLYLDPEYRRYYPLGEIAAHIVGTTDIDDKGMEGAEKIFDSVLRGTPGAKRIVRDRYARTIEQIELIKSPQYGRALRLSIDQRIQYHAYRALKKAVRQYHAESGSIVVLDAKTGEALAVASQPSFNPNERGAYRPRQRRSRAIVDMFEPGSTIKPFVVAALLDNDVMAPDTVIDTSPGYYQVSGNKIQDARDFGPLDLTGIVVKSSNVGISKAAMKMQKEDLWKTFDQLGFGHSPGIGFPGETGGLLHDYTEWREIDHAVMSYGYGIATSLIQLAHAYTVFANDGWQPYLSLLKVDTPPEEIEKRRIFKPATARYLRSALKQATGAHGTGRGAKVESYTTAGKTGTVRKSSDNEDDPFQYLSLFVGFVPADAPRLVAAVMIDAPHGKRYYGGEVAAPVFAEAMTHALRVSDIQNDDQARGKFSDAQALKGMAW